MTDDAVVWHYGLMAERWAEFVTDTPELEYLLGAIERFGQPVLDLGCGVGRLLRPLMRAGIDIDGCDISPDMLFHCRRKAADEGLAPHLIQSPMHAFQTPRRYRTIYIIGSIGLAGSRENDMETLRRCQECLEQSGALIVNIQAEYNEPDWWNRWLPEGRDALPEPWPEDGAPQVAPDGSEHSAFFRMLDVDPLSATYTRQVRLEKRASGKLVASEERILKENVYFANELRLMLQTAGFREIETHGDYTDEAATSDHYELIFTAIK
jgi:SAM-dependent methyltransferase